MLDWVIYATGAAVLLALLSALAVCIALMVYWAVAATLDVGSQFLLLKVQRRPRAQDVTVWDAWCSSFGRPEWRSIGGRVRRIFKS